MKLSNAFAILTPIRFSIQQAFRPTLVAILKYPILIFRPRTVSQIFFYHVWTAFSDRSDADSDEVKLDLIKSNAYGVVLDLGAGLGHTALYLSPSRVKKYIALEPNLLMHPHIKEKAARTGFSEESGTLLILSCGAEDIHSIMSAIGGQNQVDTLVSVLTLCSVPQPEHTIGRLVETVLKPGGQLLFIEHVASKLNDVRFWQWFWSPIWKICFDHCNITRPTDKYIRNLKGVWEAFPGVDAAGARVGTWWNEEIEENLLPHQVGRLIKRSA